MSQQIATTCVYTYNLNEIEEEELIEELMEDSSSDEDIYGSGGPNENHTKSIYYFEDDYASSGEGIDENHVKSIYHFEDDYTSSSGEINEDI